MNDTIRLTPEVDVFVAAVRACFADLEVDEREDLLDGLEADTADLVAERGPEALGDPQVYAAELRAAAGLPPAGAPIRVRAPLGTRIEGLLDGAHQRWEAFASGLPGDPWGFAQVLRPFWWVARAWVALQVVDLFWGGGSYNYGLSPVPSLGAFGVPALILAVYVSVQIGRGKLWPSRPRSATAGRLLLLALNLFAVAMAPVTISEVFTPAKAVQWGMNVSYSEQAPTSGLSFNGEPLLNIYPYDAAGNPLVGVQLVDDKGRRLRIDPDSVWITGQEGRSLTPWLNGRTRLLSVFPLPEQRQDLATGKLLGEPALQTPPFAVLPKVTLEGVTPTRTMPTKDTAPAKKQGDKPGNEPGNKKADAKTRP